MPYKNISQKEYYKNWREKNKEKIDKYRREWRMKNKGKMKKHSKTYSDKHQKEIKAYRKKNKEKIKKICKEWRVKNKERDYENHKRWRKENREWINERNRKWIKSYLKVPKKRLDVRISTSICKSLKGNKAGRRWETLVGYTLQDLYQHLEKQFDDKMTWENYGSYWHLDHIVPKSWFPYQTREEQAFKNCWSLANLQPLEAKENLIKHNHFILQSQRGGM